LEVPSAPCFLFLVEGLHHQPLYQIEEDHMELWLIHRWEVDDCHDDRFVGTIAIVDTEAEANEVIRAAPTAKSIVEGYAYTKQRIMKG
jgi:hypothetical protein